jgi:hypothetical protein
MSGIELLLEGLQPNPGIGLQEGFGFVLTQVQIGIDDGLDGVHHLVVAEGRPDDIAQRGVLVGTAAERDLVELLAPLIDAEDADVANVMVATGVDAT